MGQDRPTLLKERLDHRTSKMTYGRPNPDFSQELHDVVTEKARLYNEQERAAGRNGHEDDYYWDFAKKLIARNTARAQLSRAREAYARDDQGTDTGIFQATVDPNYVLNDKLARLLES